MTGSIVPLDEKTLAEIGFTPIGFLKAFLNGGDIPPVYRLDDDLGMESGDFAAWRGKARIRAIVDREGAPDRVTDLEGAR